VDLPQGKKRGIVRLVAVNPDQFSLGLAYLEASLAAYFGSRLQIEQSIHDLSRVRHGEADMGTLIARVTAGDPVLIGFSWYCWNHRLIQDLAQMARRLCPRTPIVVGGPEAGTIDDAELERFPEGTIFVVGEGEAILPAIIERVLAGEPVDLLPGTARRDASGILRATRPQAAIQPSRIASPLLAGTLKDAASAWLPSYATTRGCVFKCSFCAWQDGFREREFDLDVVLRELDLLAERAYERIWFTDTIFGRNEARYLTILQRMQQWPTATRFAVELHAKYLSSRLAAELAKVPLAWAAVGIQSLAPDVLRLTRRSPDAERLLTAVGALYAACPDRSAIHLDIIFGLPRQTLDDCFETVDLLLE
jgi:radical SAM superfamily enzyme YgiQ (UPF0313 family)